jgi:hypothetical protein
MSAIPDDAFCWICKNFYADPPKTGCASLSKERVFGCRIWNKVFVVKGAQIEPSHFVCKHFVGVYTREADGSPYPPAPPISHHQDYLWENYPSQTEPVWIFKPYVRFSDLPDGDFGEYDSTTTG